MPAKALIAAPAIHALDLAGTGGIVEEEDGGDKVVVVGELVAMSRLTQSKGA